VCRVTRKQSPNPMRYMRMLILDLPAVGAKIGSLEAGWFTFFLRLAGILVPPVNGTEVHAFG